MEAILPWLLAVAVPPSLLLVTVAVVASGASIVGALLSVLLLLLLLLLLFLCWLLRVVRSLGASVAAFWCVLMTARERAFTMIP